MDELDFSGGLSVLTPILLNNECDIVERRTIAVSLGNEKSLCGDARAIGPLVEVLKDDDVLLRRASAEALGRIGDARAVEPLIVLLKGDRHDVRWIAADSLGNIGDAGAVEPLKEALKDDDDNLRLSAAISLGKLGDIRAVEPLIEALKNDEKGLVRRAATEALGKLGDARAVEPLIEIIKHMSHWPDEIRIDSDSPILESTFFDYANYITEALVAIGDARAVEALIEALNYNFWEVRCAAAEALGKLGDARAVEPLVEVVKKRQAGICESQDDAFAALVKFGPSGVNSLIKAMSGDNEDSDSRANVTECLEGMGAADWQDCNQLLLPPLIEALRGRDMALRANAALVLGEIKGAQAVQPLIWALDDEEIIVRLNAAVSLGKLGDVRAAIPLAKAMKEGNQDVRHRAYDALVKLGVNLGEVTAEVETIEIAKMRSELERERIHLEMAKIKNEKTKFVESMEAPPNEEIDDEQKPSVVQNITYNIQDSAISGDIKATGLKKKDD